MVISDDGRFLAGMALAGVGVAALIRRGSGASESGWLRELRPEEYEEDETWKPRAHGPSRVLVIGGKKTLVGQSEPRRHVLAAGRRDDVSVFVEKDRPLSEGTVYVVTENTSMGYIGVEAFGPEDDEAPYDRSWFAQHDEQAEDALGPRWARLRHQTVAARIANNYWH